MSAVLPKNFSKQKSSVYPENNKLGSDYDVLFAKMQEKLRKAIYKERNRSGIKSIINQSSIYNLDQLSRKNSKRR